MADALGDLLPKRQFEEPPEVRIIKDFVMEKFNQPVQVGIQQTQIIIQVKSAALAGALRPHLYVLQSSCETEKRLVIRIG
mgnify:CR=1 FL=1